MLAGLAFCEMLSQHPQSAFQGLSGGRRGFSSSLRPKPSASICSVWTRASKKAHKHELFGPVALGTAPGTSRGQTGFVPGTSPLCPRDKPRVSPYFTQWKPSLLQEQTEFVPGTIPGTKGGRKSLCVKSLCAFSLANTDHQIPSCVFCSSVFSSP